MSGLSQHRILTLSLPPPCTLPADPVEAPQQLFEGPNGELLTLQQYAESYGWTVKQLVELYPFLLKSGGGGGGNEQTTAVSDDLNPEEVADAYEELVIVVTEEAQPEAQQAMFAAAAPGMAPVAVVAGAAVQLVAEAPVEVEEEEEHDFEDLLALLKN